jgi:hypothetical protein
MSASVVSPCMFRSHTWPSSGDVLCTMLLFALLLCHYFTWVCKIVTKQQSGKQYCTRNIPWRWSSMWPKHAAWHNRRRYSNILKSDCVLMCILKHSAWVGVLNNVVLKPFRYELFSVIVYKSQQDAHVKDFILSDNCSTCFGRYYHPSSGAQTTVTTASGNRYTLLLSAAIVEELELIWVCCGWRIR